MSKIKHNTSLSQQNQIFKVIASMLNIVYLNGVRYPYSPRTTTPFFTQNHYWIHRLYFSLGRLLLSFVSYNSSKAVGTLQTSKPVTSLLLYIMLDSCPILKSSTFSNPFLSSFDKFDTLTLLK